MVGLVGRLWPEGTLWCNIVDKEFLSSLSAQERKRQEVIFELISTERRYVEDVAMILNVRPRDVLNIVTDSHRCSRNLFKLF